MLEEDLEFKALSVPRLLFFSLVTLGAYIPYWYYRRQHLVDRLANQPSNPTLRKMILAALVLGLVAAVYLPLALITNFKPSQFTISLGLILRTLGSIANILCILFAFHVHKALDKKIQPRLSVPATLFGNIFYLQYRINLAIDVLNQGTTDIPALPLAPADPVPHWEQLLRFLARACLGISLFIILKILPLAMFLSIMATDSGTLSSRLIGAAIALTPFLFVLLIVLSFWWLEKEPNRYRIFGGPIVTLFIAGMACLGQYPDLRTIILSDGPKISEPADTAQENIQSGLTDSPSNPVTSLNLAKSTGTALPCLSLPGDHGIHTVLLEQTVKALKLCLPTMNEESKGALAYQSINADILEILSHESRSVRARLLANPVLPEYLRASLAHDPDPSIRAMALARAKEHLR